MTWPHPIFTETFANKKDIFYICGMAFPHPIFTECFANKKDIPNTASETHREARVFVTYSGSPINHFQGTTLRLKKLNEAIFGKDAGIIITPQMIRKWNTTYLSTHSDEDLRKVRGIVTGNEENVFQEHYNLETYALIRDATLALRKEHHKDGGGVKKLSKLVSPQIADGLRQEAIEEFEAQAARRFNVTKIDQSSKTSPIDSYTRAMLKDSIS